jgi:hypothetical protein
MSSVVLLFPRIVREHFQFTLNPLHAEQLVVDVNEALTSEKVSASHFVSRVVTVPSDFDSVRQPVAESQS